MEKRYKVVYDEGNVYEVGTTISGNELIEHYLEIADGFEDADTIGWIMANKDKEEVIEYITNSWLMRLEELTDETKE